VLSACAHNSEWQAALAQQEAHWEEKFNAAVAEVCMCAAALLCTAKYSASSSSCALCTSCVQ
jgi:hypothetical protein